ncbi:hypothetical protein F7725_024415 [Dissostichus mawsoni]|uniref:Uncharacterized protein n=1 Tax=Dissostichus mawsoni TaxID=36200 RepID=A0A7J5XZ99_DISMA|nr:hypothetical protein F7725_024415 [Dissostichus mawsoni]
MLKCINRTAQFKRYIHSAGSSFSIKLNFRLVSSLPLRMTDPAVNRVVSEIIRLRKTNGFTGAWSLPMA